MSTLTKQEERIWEETLRLHWKYADKDLAHDAHGIWLLAGDAARCLTLPYGRPGLKAATGLVNYYLSLYRAEQNSVTNPVIGESHPQESLYI